MKKAAALLLAAIMVLAIALAAGCGGSDVTVETDEGKVTTSEKDGTVKVESEEGETVVSTKKGVTEEDLGVPIYPGAKLEDDAAGSVTSKNAQGETTWSMAVLWTKDSVEKVTAWYRDKLSGKPGFNDMSMTSGGEAMGMMMFQADDQTVKTVTIGKDTVDHPGATTIAISSASGADMRLPQ